MEHPFAAAMADAEQAPAMTIAAGWPAAASVAAAVLLWFAIWYWDTARAMVSTWRNSETYAHGFLVVPITVWLIWRERARLASTRPRPELKVLPLLLLPGVAWLLGELSGVRIVQQFALILMIVLTVWTLLGFSVTRTLAFPLLFLLFAVPAGDFLLPLLMEHTARFTVFALAATGVPVHREGMSITVPTGEWSIVEACSGLRYLMACFTGGVLYAYMRYRSLGRRLAFVAAAAAVPVLANGLRAYLIVMLGEVSGGRIAADVDHLLYGWVFFGVVTLLLFTIGAIWREDFERGPSPAARTAMPPARRPRASSFVSGGIAAAVTVAVWPVMANQIDRIGPAGTASISVPAPEGWQPLGRALSDWRPRLAAPTALVEESYASGRRRAALSIAYYGDQRHGSELVSSVNRLASEDGAWHVVAESGRTVVAAGEQLSSIESRIQSGDKRLLVWRWYWVDGRRTTSAYRAKLLQIRSVLQGRGEYAAMVMLYTDADAGDDQAASVLGNFAAAALPGITRALEQAR